MHSIVRLKKRNNQYLQKKMVIFLHPVHQVSWHLLSSPYLGIFVLGFQFQNPQVNRSGDHHISPVYWMNVPMWYQYDQVIA